jgi:CheY-like chemotaxis protein
LLGGNAFVRSEVGIGSTFYAQIPSSFRGATEVVYTPEVSTEFDAGKLPILVVEDNREALFVYEKYLKGSPFQPIPARNLKEARMALQSFRPAAIILDVLLETEQSWELLQELKSNSSTASLPVFVITVVENQAKAYALGATGFHSKPIDRAWILEQLNTYAEEQSKLRVLLVDDDAASRYVVKTVLGDRSFRFIEAGSGNEGIRLANESKPNLIILDLVMPDLTGFEVLDRLKKEPRTAEIPVVIHTSRDLDRHDRETLASAVGIVEKQGRSRESARASFAQAFAAAGLSVPEMRTGEIHEPEGSAKR